MANIDLSSFPALTQRVKDGWHIEVEWVEFQKRFHARVWRSHTGNSHNYAGKTHHEALLGLEEYIQSPAAAEWDEKHSPVRTTTEPT